MQRLDGRSRSADEPTFSSSARLQIEQNGTPTRYRITMEPTQQRWLFALDMPTQWRKDGVYMSGYHTLERRRPVDERLSYNVTSHTEAATALQLSSSAQDWYTRLPSSGNDDARALAAQMREASGSSSDYVNRVLRYFRDEPFYYTLTPPALGRNSVDEFLFRSRRGFCEHYASSFTFMMRAAGIPARIVAGYQGGERNPLSDHWTVRQSDAHAWSEVWLAGRGWTRVDPTAAVAPSRIEQNLESALREFGEFEPGAFELPFMERLQLTWDMINAKWNEWVLGFGPETQRNFFEWLGLSDPDWRDLVIILAIWPALHCGLPGCTARPNLMLRWHSSSVCSVACDCLRKSAKRPATTRNERLPPTRHSSAKSKRSSGTICVPAMPTMHEPVVD